MGPMTIVGALTASLVALTGLAEAPAVTDDENGAPVQVASPTGNIRCMLWGGGTDGTGSAQCLVGEADYPEIEPSCAQGDWIDSLFSLTADGGVRGGCLYDMPFEQAPAALPYSTTVLTQGEACRSEESGMTCWSLSTGHGFSVSRDDYELY